MKQVFKITEMIDRICEIVRTSFDISVDEDDVAYSRFVLHLRFLIERLMQGNPIDYAHNKDLLDVLSEKYPKQYKCVNDIVEYLSKAHQNRTSPDEMLYILIHVIKLTTAGQEVDD